MPFIEVAHTADWCLRVWSAELPSLFTEAARGMYALAGVKIASQPVQEKEFSSAGPDSGITAGGIPFQPGLPDGI